MKHQFAGFLPDFFGFSASLICALHCALLPFLLSLTPLAGLRWLETPGVEYTLFLTSVLIAIFALVPGYRRHRKSQALLITIVGFLIVGTGHLLSPEAYEATLTTVGAMAVALGHLINWKLTVRYRRDLQNCLVPSRA